LTKGGFGRELWFMRLAPAVSLALLAITAATAKAHDCTCKFAGGDAKQGETACIMTAKGKSLARCEMMLNNSSWTVLDEPCPVEQSQFQLDEVPLKG
jgi:hypothetical protein